MLEAITWWLTLEVLGLAAVPVCAVVFRPLAGSGYAMSKALGLLLVGWLAYSFAMAGLPFGRPLLGGCLLVLAAFDLWLLFRRGGQFFAELRARFSTPAFRRYILTAEVFFAMAFALWAVVRSTAPDIWGTEKFMDYGFLNSVLRSGSFPPKDMWLAGYGINYYYFGYVLTGALTNLSGVTPAVAFPLANVSLFALTALGAFGFTYDLVSGAINRRVNDAAGAVERPAATHPARGQAAGFARPPGSHEAAHRLARLASTALHRTGVQAPALQVSSVTLNAAGHSHLSTSGSKSPSGDTPAAPSPQGSEYDDPAPAATVTVPPYLSPYVYAVLAALLIVAMGNVTTLFGRKSTDFQGGGNGWQFCFMCQTTSNFDWWAPSRIIRDFRTTTGSGGAAPAVVSSNQTINEFPAFSLFLGDLHPHVMALPLVLLAASTAYALARGKPRKDRGRRGLSPWVTLVVSGIVLGSLYATNTWDYPTYVLVTLAGLAVGHFAASHEAGTSRSAASWLLPALLDGAVIMVTSIVAFLPFHLTFKSLVGGQAVPVPEPLQGSIGGIIIGKLDSVLLLNTSDKTIVGFLVVFGIFLVALVGWLVYTLAVQLARSPADECDTRLRALLVRVVGGAAVLSILVGVVLRFPLFAFLVPLIVTAVVLITCEPKRVERNLALAMFAVTGTIALVIEVVFLRDVFADRMNTLFKFYFQIWVVWSLLSAYAAWEMLYSTFGPGRTIPSGFAGVTAVKVPKRSGARLFTGGVCALFALLALSGMTYLVYAQGRQLHDRTQDPNFQLTLDGTRFLQFSSPGDLEAIKWLSAAANPADVVLECCRDEYITHAGRISAFTGIPTLLAWDGHEKQWRGDQPQWANEIISRRSIVNAVYRGADPAGGAAGSLTGPGLLDLLHRNHVTYVVDGEAEKGLAGAAGQYPEERVTPHAEYLFHQTLAVVYRSSNGQTTVYSVPR